MRRVVFFTALLTVIPRSAPAAEADAARAIVEKAIEAQGGPEKVAKLRTMRIKVEGKVTLLPDKPFPFVIEDLWRMPDKYKTTTTGKFEGKEFAQTQTIDGDSGWIQEGGQVRDIAKDALAEMKEQKWAEDLDRLGFLKDKSLKFSLAGETKVGGKPAVGVLIESEGHKEVKLWFDKESGLLVKREHPVFDVTVNKEVTQEVTFADYQEKDGVKHYTKITATRGGFPFVEGKVVEVQFFDKLDDKTFAKPK